MFGTQKNFGVLKKNTFDAARVPKQSAPSIVCNINQSPYKGYVVMVNLPMKLFPETPS